MSKIEEGNSVTVHYVGTLEDGTQFDSSRDRGEPISFVVGGGQMISGFDQNIRGMELGETKTFTISPEEGYGQSDPEAIQEVAKEQFPDGFEPDNGVLVRGVNENNEEIVAIINKNIVSIGRINLTKLRVKCSSYHTGVMTRFHVGRDVEKNCL